MNWTSGLIGRAAACEAAHVYAHAHKDGKQLVLGENDELPDFSGKTVAAGMLEIASGSCTAIVL